MSVCFDDFFVFYTLSLVRAGILYNTTFSVPWWEIIQFRSISICTLFYRFAFQEFCCVLFFLDTGDRDAWVM
jgi:hypothetical protein